MPVQPIVARNASQFDGPFTVPYLLERSVRLYGDREFLVDSQRRLTFSQTERASAELAKGLLSLGLGKGARLGLMMPNIADWVLGWLAGARMGAMVVSLSSFFQPREIDWALNHNDIDTLLIPAEYAGHGYIERLERAIPELKDQTGPLLHLKSHPYLRRIVIWGDCDRAWAMKGPDDILAAARARPQIDDDYLAQIESLVTPADDMIIICTSGTTANPKAVVHTHASALRNTWCYSSLVGLNTTDKVVNMMPFFWVGGHLLALMPAFYDGATMLFPDSLHAGDVLDLILAEKATYLNLTPAATNGIHQEAARRGVTLPPHRKVNMQRDKNGREIPPDRRVGGSMGMTETFGGHSGDAYDEPTPPGKAGHWGRGLAGIERRIVDRETGEVLAPNKEGELYLRGPSLMRGYYKRERLEVLTPDGFFPTGDRCVIDEEGYIYFHGRYTEMIKTTGANVAPQEVEAVLLTFPEIAEAIVFGVPDEKRGEAVAAVVVLRVGADFDAADMRRRIGQEISGYKVPVHILAVDSEDIPRTDSGKTKRHEIRDLALARLGIAKATPESV